MKHSESNESVIQSILSRFIVEHKLKPHYVETAQEWFIPLAKNISKHQSSANKTIIVGINGCQGSGKSTLSSLLISLLNDVFKQPTIGFSIDDFYLSKQERSSLAASVNPLLKTRGVPGTHNIHFLEATLKNLIAGENVNLPIFDKAIDDVVPLSEWPATSHPYKIIILEGWCVGIDSQKQKDLESPVNAFETMEDKSKHWRQYVNDILSVDYKRVFTLIDYMVMLKAPSFDHVFKWRCEQEHKLIQSLKRNPKKPVDTHSPMSDEQIFDFVQFYQRLTEHALRTLPDKCNSLFTLDSKRGIQSCLHK